ncbi:MAG: adenylosuccinate synthetase [Candidatus Bathyarchaeia archaeon]
MPCTVLVCGFFGDTGKGKMISYLALKDKTAVTARAGVGPNAGHTVVYEGKTYKLRMLPSAFTAPDCRLLIGPGVLVNPDIFANEVTALGVKGRVGIDPQCAVIEPKHMEADKHGFLAQEIKSTGSGSGPCNSDRVMRIAKLARDFPNLKDYLVDVPLEVNTAICEGKNVLIEGTQGTYLSLFHGTYPYCTSKDVCAAAACSDVGVGPTNVDDVIVVFKAYNTRVGAGPLNGELSWEEAERRGWAEIATNTGRKRRAAPFDFDLAKRAVMLNGATQLAVTKIDVLFPECAGVTSYDEVSGAAKSFVENIEKQLKVPVMLLGTGPGTLDVVDRRAELKKR